MTGYVNSVRNKCNYKLRDIIKLLDDPSEWELCDADTIVEKFKHKSGWYFYTGVNFVYFYNDEFSLDTGIIRCLWYKLIKKEKKFVEKWLKLQEDK